MDEFPLDAAVAEELLLPTARPRAEMHPQCMYVILHFPALRHTRKTREQELDFVVGKDFIITTRYDTFDPLHTFGKLFEVDALIDEHAEAAHGGLIFYFMLRKIYRTLDHEVSSVRGALQDIEQHIFMGQESEMVIALSHAGRDLLDLRQFIEPHRDILHEIETIAPAFFGNGFARYLRNLSNEYYRVHNHIMRETESMHELRATNDSLLTTKQNETTKVLTVMAFVTFPLSVIASLFGMNLSVIPFSDHPQGFWFILGIMLLLASIMVFFFRRKKWL